MTLVAQVIHQVRNQYFETQRGGPTGVGYTLETSVFKKSEDNRAEADFHGWELKAVTRSKETLSKRVRAFTNSCGDEMNLLHEFGTQRQDGKTRFCSTVRNGGRGRVGGHTTAIEQDDNHVFILSDNRCLATWTKASFLPIFENKLSRLAIVSSRKKLIEGKQHFNYYHSDLHSGFSEQRFWTLLQEGVITIEFRLSGTKTDGEFGSDLHDHGTCFNITTKNLPRLYTAHYSTAHHDLHLKDCLGEQHCEQCSGGRAGTSELQLQ